MLSQWYSYTTTGDSYTQWSARNKLSKKIPLNMKGIKSNTMARLWWSNLIQDSIDTWWRNISFYKKYTRIDLSIEAWKIWLDSFFDLMTFHIFKKRNTNSITIIKYSLTNYNSILAIKHFCLSAGKSGTVAIPVFLLLYLHWWRVWLFWISSFCSKVAPRHIKTRQYTQWYNCLKPLRCCFLTILRHNAYMFKE